MRGGEGRVVRWVLVPCTAVAAARIHQDFEVAALVPSRTAATASEHSSVPYPVISPIRYPGLVHIPKTGGERLENSVAPTCGMVWGESNLALHSNLSWLFYPPSSGASEFCRDAEGEQSELASDFNTSVLNTVIRGRSIFSEHIPPIFWRNQYGSDPYAWYGSLFAVVRNPYSRAVSSWKHFMGHLFNHRLTGLSAGTVQAGYGFAPATANLSWPESEACDPRHLNEWLATYLPEVEGFVRKIEATHELPPFDDMRHCALMSPAQRNSTWASHLPPFGGGRRALACSIGMGFQNMVPQWLYVSPKPSDAAPDGYPVGTVLAFERLNDDFHKMATTSPLSAFSSHQQRACLANISTDEHRSSSNHGEPDCNTNEMLSAMNATNAALIARLFARDFEMFGYSTNLSRAAEPPAARRRFHV